MGIFFCVSFPFKFYPSSNVSYCTVIQCFALKKKHFETVYILPHGGQNILDILDLYFKLIYWPGQSTFYINFSRFVFANTAKRSANRRCILGLYKFMSCLFYLVYGCIISTKDIVGFVVQFLL